MTVFWYAQRWVSKFKVKVKGFNGYNDQLDRGFDQVNVHSLQMYCQLILRIDSNPSPRELLQPDTTVPPAKQKILRIKVPMWVVSKKVIVKVFLL